MPQAQFSLDESLLEFVRRSEQYGFRSPDELVRLALTKLQEEVEQLETSAQLYAEDYQTDLDLQALTDSAISFWE